MCGRVVQTLPHEAMRRLFKARQGDLFNAPPRWNGAPTDKLMIVRRDPESGERSLDLVRWGLVPHFAKDLKGGARLINARCETVATTPAFRGAWGKNRRCLVPVDGFYEWRREGTVKQPYAVSLADEPMALAGLWENWKDSATGEWVRTFTILTTAPNELIAPFHDRMPVIVPEADWERWLAGEDATDLLGPFPAARMRMWPVSTAVNKVGGRGAVASVVGGRRRDLLSPFRRGRHPRRRGRVRGWSLSWISHTPHPARLPASRPSPYGRG
jgi:putative SOS response-associated peptidase YedK